MKHLYASCILALGLWAGSASLRGQADVNYHSGISLSFSGTHEQDYAIEPYFANTLIHSRATIYIKAATDITATHNARNIEADGNHTVIGAEGGGVIRYKVDGDLNVSWRWSVSNQLPAYSAPFSFSDLTYPGTSTAVVGTTGGNGQAITSKTTYYHYGIEDLFGDEWHTITFADDDDALSTNTENKASDSKVWAFVVNPTTPAFLPSVTGDGQFYTTPAKVYYAPTIHEQTTYIAPGTGSVSIKLVDINGGNISYKIGAGSTVNAGAASVELADTDFEVGSQILEYWITATPAVTRTREIVKNPAFPSAGETHGYLVFADADEYDDWVSRLARTPYSTRWSAIQTNNTVAGKDTWDTYRLGGWRAVPGVGTGSKSRAFPNALAALVNGWTAVPSGKARSWATYAKEMLLENPWRVCPVGWETDWNSQPVPAREVIGAGYYTARQLIDMAAAYDLLVANYKSTQVTGGLTAIEDLFIRDCMASAVFHTLQYYGGFTGFSSPGMWGSSLAATSHLIMFTMPDYDTPFYGTSGANGTTAASHTWTPFQTDVLSWKDVFLDVDAGAGAYPNLRWTYDADELMSSDGYWIGTTSIGYWSGNTAVGYVTSVLHNALALHAPLVEWPETRAAILHSVSGTMEQTGDPGVDLYYPMLAALNRRFPDIAAIGIPAAVERGVNLDQELYRLGPLSTIWYDDQTEAIAEQVQPVTFTPGGGVFVGPQTVALSTSTTDAEIRYSMDGTSPSVVYSSPLLVSADLAIRANATKPAMEDSIETSATYEIDTATPAAEWAEIGVGTFEDSFVANFVVSVAQAGANLTVGIGPAGQVNDWADLACIVRWNESNVIDARNGASYTADSVYPYSANTSYSVVMTVNMTANTYDVRVNGTLIAEDYAFRTEHSAASTLTTLAWRMTDPEYIADISGISAYLVTPPARGRASPRSLMLMP